MEKRVEKEGGGVTSNLLIHNFVALQKVLVTLSEKIDDLTKQLSRMIELFEEAAGSFKERRTGIEEEGKSVEDDLIEKLDSLLEQNKTIAKGLTLLEKKIREGTEEESRSRPLPEFRF